MTNASPKLPALPRSAPRMPLRAGAGAPGTVLLGAPFLVALVIGVALMRPFDVQVSARLLNDRVNEGDDVTLDIELAAAVPVSWVEVALRLPDGLAPAEEPAANLVTLAPGGLPTATRDSLPPLGRIPGWRHLRSRAGSFGSLRPRALGARQFAAARLPPPGDGALRRVADGDAGLRRQ